MENFFFENSEREAFDEFLENGYLITPLEDLTLLEDITKFILQFSKEFTKTGISYPIGDFLNKTHEFIPQKELNSFRMKLIQAFDQFPDFRKKIYLLFRRPIHNLVGNELAMQRSLNLSIQYPGDDSSLFPIHADTWTGSSPYEVVTWLPLGNCFKTKSMFILPLKKTREVYSEFKRYSHLDSEEFFQILKKDLIWLEVPYGKGLIFSHSLIHGNRVNEENEVRWSFNIRFKSLLSPYGSKGLGESFLPFIVRPATRMGYGFTRPII